MSTTEIVNESFIRLTELQIETIKRLKESALQNKQYAPHKFYLQGFLKACDIIIEIIDNPITEETNGENENNV